jgi:ATP-binding cassette, subfamily B, multidrug efflux pump
LKQLFRSFRFLKKYWYLALGALLSLFVTTVASLAIPRLSQTMIDQGLGQRNIQLVLSLSIIMLVLAIVQGLFQFTQGAWAARSAEGIAFDMRNTLYSKIQSLSFSYHDRSQTGQLLTRATSDVEMVQRFLGQGLITLVSALLMMVGALILLFTTNWRLALVMVVVIPVTAVIFSAFIRAAQPLFKKIQERLSTLNVVLQENIAGVRVVKAFVREPHEADRYRKANLALYDVNLQVNRVLSLAFPSIFTMANVATLCIYWIGGNQVIAGSLTIGELVAFTSYVMMAFFPVVMMGFVLSMFSQAAASAERIYEIIDTNSEVVEKPGAQAIPAIQGRVAFEDVTFRYYQSGDPVLKNVSFVAEPGQAIALLGATGSGKSTIINLIPRFYEVCDGKVTVDEYDIRDVTLESLRAQIGIVLQETNLFEGSIRENIAFGRPDATLEDVMEAAKAAEAHEFIVSFTDGYETRVGERGVTLSGGQKQRVAIARALLLNPKVLILDDATSSVDLTTEFKIQKALDRLMKGRTSFVIAQRVATVLNADQILVLDKGEIVARGTHEELLDNSEIYAEIYHSQLQDSSKTDLENPVAPEVN